MSVITTHESILAIPLREKEDGRLLVGESRVPLETVVGAFRDGATPEEIVIQFPSLELPDVYSTVTFYLQNTRKVEEYLRERELHRLEVRRENERRFPQKGIRQRLLARMQTPVT